MSQSKLYLKFKIFLIFKTKRGKLKRFLRFKFYDTKRTSTNGFDYKIYNKMEIYQYKFTYNETILKMLV